MWGNQQHKTRNRHRGARRALSTIRGRRGTSPFRGRSLRLEPLEDRRLLAVFLDLQGAQTLVAGANVNVSGDAARVQSEMLIDVNPTNPLNLAGLSHRISGSISVELYYSNDGGTTWTTNPVVDGVDGFTSTLRFDPTIAFDSLGRLYLGYGVDDTATNTRRIVVGRSSDGGATFDQFSTVDTGPFNGALDKLHLATGLDPSTGNPAVYIAYSDAGFDQLKISGSNNGGAGWTTPLVINDQTGTGDNARFPKPAVGPNGELYVGWHDLDDDQLKFDRDLDGLFGANDAFGTDVVVANLQQSIFFSPVPAQPERGIFTGPVIDVDRSGGPFSGTIYFAYADTNAPADAISNANIYLHRSVNEGDTWSGRILVDAGLGAVPGNSTEFHPWVSVDPHSGTVNVAYYTSQGDQDAGNNDVNIRLAVSTDGGQTFPAAQQVNLTSATSDATGGYGGDYLEYFGLAVRDGTAHALWSDQRDGAGADQEAYTANASYNAASNVLTITGDDGGAAVNDDILIRRSAANTAFLEVIQNGAIVFAGLFASIDQIIVNTLFGDDNLTVSYVNGNPIPGGGLVYNAGDPSGSDQFTLLGSTGTESIVVNHINEFQADVSVNGGPPIAVNDAELLVIDGGSNNIGGLGDDLTVVERIGRATRFVHTPGAAPDSGRIDTSDSDGDTLIPIEYRRLDAAGTVTLVGSGAGDTLVALGTSGSDEFTVGFTGTDDVDIDLTTTAGTRVDLRTVDVGNYILEALEGDDTVTLIAQVDADSFVVNGGDPGGSDVLLLSGAAGVAETVTIAPDATNPTEQDVTGLGASIDVSGVELIRYTGDGGDDTLRVVPGAGDHAVRVDNGPEPLTDRVTSDALPEIHFTDLLNFVVDEDSQIGNIVATFVTGSLAGAINYQTILDGEDTLVIEGSDGAADNFRVSHPVGVPVVAVTDVASGVTVTDLGTGVPSPLGRLQINTLGGDDMVTVDNSTGLINVPITYDGGSGSDTLLVTGTTAVQQVEYFPGPDVLEGRLAYSLTWGPPPSRDMVIDFINLEPVIDLVPKTVALTVYGTNADNAINYTEGPNSGVVSLLNPLGLVTGLVSVDAYETIEFANFTGPDDVLEIIALAGDDVVNLNNPTTPAGLERIWVEGNDPTASDKVIVTGTSGADTVTIDTLSVDGARVTGLGPAITIHTAEHLVYDGLGGNDTLTHVAPDNSLIDLFPGVEIGSGTIETYFNLGLIKVSFEGLGSAATLSLASVGGGRVNFLYYHGTADDDVFNVSALGVIELEKNPANTVDLAVATPGIGQLGLYGLAGDDTFNLPGNHPFPGLFGAAGITVQGGDPGASDVLNFTGSATVANLITADFGVSTVQEATFGAVSFSGIEVLNVNANAHNLTIRATAGDDTLAVTPTGASAATARLAGSDPAIGESPVVNGANIGTLSVDLLGGSDQLIVHGNEDGNFITITGALVTVDSTNPPSLALETVNYSGVEFLQVNAGAGNDTIDVTPSLTTSIFVDGGDPIGNTAGDLIMLHPLGPYSVEPGPESDEGGLNTFDGTQRVSWDHIEAVAVVGGGPGLTLGTNGDDDITIIARDASTHPLPGVNGVQDFTVSVNGGPDVLYIDSPVHLVDALAGDDDIVVREPAPNGAVWNVQLFIAGGTPSSATGDQGDVVEVESPGVQTAVFTPNPASIPVPALPPGVTLTPTVGGLDTAMLNDTTNASVIAVAPFTLTFGLPLPVFTYVSSPGGAEQFVYDGEGTADLLSMVGTATHDVFEYTPVGQWSATVRMNNAMPLAVVDVPAPFAIDGGTGGSDLMIVNGTDGDDEFTVLPTSSPPADVGAVQIVNRGAPLVGAIGFLYAPQVVRQVSIEGLILNGLAGDDEFSLNAGLPYGNVEVNGQGPGGSDVLLLSGAAGVAETVTIAPDATNPTEQDVTGLGASIDVSGVELIRYTGDGGDDTLRVVPGAGDHAVRVDNGPEPLTDRVTSDALPEIHFTDLLNFVVDEDSQIGNIVATFVTGSLAGAINYQTILDGEDTLVIEGSDGAADNFRVSHPVGVPVVAVTDVASGVTVTDLGTGVPSPLGRLQINTLGGDDMVTVDNSTGLINVPITYDGGSGSDTLLVTGTTAVQQVEYFPGPDVLEGRLAYSLTWGPPPSRDMVIDFINLEPVIDLVVAANLTVNGTPGDDVINVEPGPAGPPVQGQVTVNNFELIDFANKTTLVVNGQAGSDVINVNLTARPAGLTGITINADGPANTFAGNDRVTILNLPLTGTGFTGPVTVNGGPGDDFVDGSALVAGLGTPALVLNGDAGNDTLIGGCAADTINGGSGDDVMAGGPDVAGIANADTFNGGAGWDTIVVSGTGTTDPSSWNDTIDVFQQAPNGLLGGNFQLTVAVNGLSAVKTIVQDLGAFANTSTAPAVRPTVEEVRIEAGAGDDLIRVGVADQYTDASLANGFPEQTLRLTVHGDQPNASDRLVVRDDGLGDLILYRKGTDGRSGSVHFAPAQVGLVGQFFAVSPIVFDGIERVDFLPLNENPPASGNFGTGTDGAGRVVVFESDPFEWNDVRNSATRFDLISRVAVHPTIDPGGLLNPFGDVPPQNVPGDQDWYQFTAPKTSTFQFNLLFETIAALANGRPGLPGNGALQLELFQAAAGGGLTPIGTARPLLGARMAPFAPVVGGTATPPDGLPITGETGLYVSASVEQGQAYWLRVSGAMLPLGALVSTAINLYDLEAVETDVIGPQITKVAIWDQTTATEDPYNLFDHKDALGNPARVTPLVNALTINIRDLVGREELASSFYGALNLLVAANPGHYRLVGDANGVIPIQSVTPINDPAPVPFVVTGTVNAAVAGAINAAAGAWSATPNFYEGWTLRITSGPLDGWQTLVRGYTPGVTPTFNFEPGSLGATLPAVGDSFELRAPATGRIILTFSEPLPDDRYTLTVFDGILDIPGNRLDGENNAIEPHLNPQFPSGDFVSGGDFVARFTVDSRPEIGVWSAGSVYVDTNGNFHFDPNNLDHTNRDLTYMLGFTTDDVFAGKFYLGGPADGFDRLGAYGRVNIGGVMTYRWLITDNAGVPTVFVQTAQLNGLPVAGNFGPGAGDEVGVFVSSPTTAGGTWYLDANGDFNVTPGAPDRVIVAPEMKGFPVVGDFDGDGHDDLAVYNEQTGEFRFRLTNGVAYNWGAGAVQAVLNVGTLITGPVGFPGTRERPVAADMDMDGIDDIGLWVPDRAGVNPERVGEWYFLISNRNRPPLNVTPVNGTVNTLDHYFSPRPLGQDLFARFGNEFALPVVGNFDPPPDPSSWTASSQSGVTELSFSGTPGNDTFAFAPGQLPGTWIVTINGQAQTIQAGQIKVEFNGLGGQDRATLTGTNTSDEARLQASEGWLMGANYTVTVINVESITVDGQGGDDKVTLVDSPGNNVLVASPTQATFTGDGLDLKALQFERVNAFATRGFDRAYFTDSAGNDVFTARPISSWLMGEAQQYTLFAKFFDQVHAFSLAGGVDRANITGSSGNDLFTAALNEARMSASDNSYLLRARAFEIVNVQGGGGWDWGSVTDGLLRQNLNPSLVGTLAPSPYAQAMWLSGFSKLRQDNPPNKGGKLTYWAVDKIFAAYF